MIAHTATVESPIGPLVLAVDGHGALLRIEFTDKASPAEILARLEEEGLELLADDEPEGPTAEARRQLAEYFAGRRRTFELPLAPRGTPFQLRVWEELRRIPFGATRSYGEIAQAIGRPSASRAVGAANGANPLPIVVPCHRVIGADGSLTGFGGGLPTKRHLLAHEGVAEAANGRGGQLRLTLTGA